MIGAMRKARLGSVNVSEQLQEIGKAVYEMLETNHVKIPTYSRSMVMRK
jgi:hypothetical protein